LRRGRRATKFAAALKVAVSSVIKWAARKRRLGSVAPGKIGGHRPYLISGEHRLFVLSEVERDPNVTLHELAAALAERGLTVHPASVGLFLHREGRSFKKTVLPAEQSGPRSWPTTTCIMRSAPSDCACYPQKCVALLRYQVVLQNSD
jgi:putative transposase